MKPIPMIPRRDFLRGSFALGRMLILPRNILAQGASPNEKPDIGFIGHGAIGKSNLDELLRVANVVALCDVDESNLAAAKVKVPGAETFTDFRVMLDKMDGKLDGVLAATPDHSHYIIAMHCLKRKMPVMVQKPLTNSIAEARRLRQAAAEAGVATQMGNQTHGSGWIEMAEDILAAGLLGPVREVLAIHTKGMGYCPDLKVYRRVLCDATGFLPRARSPLLKPVIGKTGDKDFTGIWLEPGQIPDSWKSEGAELSLMPMMWIHNYLPIASWDAASGRLEFGSKLTLNRNMFGIRQMLDRKESNPRSAPIANWVGDWGCAIENSLEYLDAPGEWVADPAARLVYLWPRRAGDSAPRVSHAFASTVGNASPAAPSAEAEATSQPNGVMFPLVRELIRVEGTVDHEGSSEQPVRGLIFQGLTFTGTDRPLRPADVENRSIMNQWEFWDFDNAAIRFRSAANCKVLGCHFHHVGDLAVRADLFAQKIEVRDNLIHDTGGSGILVGGYGLGTKNVSRGNRIHNNALRDIGQITRSSMGIILWQSEGNEVSSNDLERTAYTGIAVIGRATWEPGYVKPEWGASRLDYWPWEPGTTRTVDVDAVLAKQPKGTHFLQVPELLHSRENLVKKNRVFHSSQTSSDGNAIYIAGAGRGNRVENNLVAPPSYETIRCDDDQHGTFVIDNVSVGDAFFGNKGDNQWVNNFQIHNQGWCRFMDIVPGRIEDEAEWKKRCLQRTSFSAAACGFAIRFTFTRIESRDSSRRR